MSEVPGTAPGVKDRNRDVADLSVRRLWSYLNHWLDHSSYVFLPSLVEKIRDTLRPTSMSVDSLDLGCLGGTRTALLSEIIDWLDNQSTSNMLWLCGAPGTGKTTISWSLIAELRRKQRCAGVFHFEEDGYGSEYRPSQLWRTLAYEMAEFHPAFETEIYDAVTTRTNGKLDLNNVKITFQKLVKDPLEATKKSLSGHFPVFLIDALEKCIQDTDWAILLHTLSQWPSLPRHCKLIITSRPQSDILNVFADKSIKRNKSVKWDKSIKPDESIKRMDLSMGCYDSATTKDIRTYIEHRFAEMRRIDESIHNGWPGPDSSAVSELVKHANGFFKWAAVAMDNVGSKTSNERGQRLQAIIESGSATNFDSINEYLEDILMSTVGGPPGVYAFRATMGTVFFSKKPLPTGDLHHFLQDRFVSSKPEVSMEETLHKLSPLLSFSGENKIVNLRHKAYQAYLLDSERCSSDWSIDQDRAQRRMTISCLKIMQRALKFNICGLESSYLMNEDVKDNDERIKSSISSRLSYACQFWADHLHGVVKRDNVAEIVKGLKNFLTVHLLHWFEVLSLLKTSHIASKSLLVAATWLEVRVVIYTLW